MLGEEQNQTTGPLKTIKYSLEIWKNRTVELVGMGCGVRMYVMIQ